MTKGILVTVDDARKAGFCPPGLRRYAHMLGIDIRFFVRNGVPIEELEGIDDAHVQRIVRIAREREI